MAGAHEDAKQTVDGCLTWLLAYAAVMARPTCITAAISTGMTGPSSSHPFAGMGRDRLTPCGNSRRAVAQSCA
ncbi:hypothetical protein AA309_30595 [Microvirga vignae]|uniref:Uncharacterized protein n=1 Tax=Microvirga vignae TaxID=1225564 RepID=A0A0H1R429_9HYPH|nr:hypothetical protein AA309_30595 [Microvirga vignae]